jgi:DNA-binding NarL/FixJ family response regulator
MDRSNATTGHIERARAAHARAAWADAFEAFGLADAQSPLPVDDLYRYADAAGLVGRDDDLLRLLERLWHAHSDAGDRPRAARAAFWLGMRLFALGEPGRGAGWLARAGGMLEGTQECVEHGYLMLPVAQRHLFQGELSAARDVSARAAETGVRFADRDLVIFARQMQGRALTRMGSLDEGLAFLDEALVAATTGELSPLVTGLVYCSAIATCNQAYVVERAREWTTALAHWCDEQPQLVTFTSSCRMHRSEVLLTLGAWDEALDETNRVIARQNVRGDDQAVAEAFYHQGEIHRLRGELQDAEAAYQSASRLGREPQPGHALLRHAQGHDEAAVNAIRRVLISTPDRLPRARMLPAAIEILLATGESDEARHLAEELEQTAQIHPTQLLTAMAAAARGSVLLAEGRAQEALAPLREAFDRWHQLGAAYAESRVRVEIAKACRAVGDDDGAALELDAARSVFERLRAAPDLARLAVPRRASHSLTARELEVLRLVATGKTNKEIARALFVSERTVDRHVSNIFAKVHVQSRAGATAFAYEHDLL